MTNEELLEEAKRRYPIGTKYKCPENIGISGLGVGIFMVELGDEIKFRKDDEIDIIGKGYIYYKGKWAEILEKPKVETKFEKGKWYELKYLFNKKPCNILAKSTSNSINKLKFGKYYDLNDEKWLIAKSFSIDTEIKIIYIKELSLQEIQQYLPDGHPDKFTTSIAKEEFVLPEKWCVKVTDSNYTTINKWKCTTNWPDTAKSWDYVRYDGVGCPDTEINTEITFEQFKKYVLKQEVEKEVKPIERWSVDSYIVALENCCIGISKFNTGDIAIVLNNSEISLLSDNSIWSCGKDRDISHNDVKWFPTLQEAQKFSDELLGKSKTSLRVEDLVEGEIYYWEYLPYKYISKCLGGFRSGASIYLPDNKFTNDKENIKKVSTFADDYSWNIRNVTLSEKKWLNTCIKQDKFIEQSELDKYDNEGNLMESKKYPEYVECISPRKGYTTHPNAKEYGCINYDYNTSLTKGRVYKVLKYIQINSGKWGFVLEFDGKHYLLGEAGAIKSTKEAYEAQFKKDDKFKNGDWLVYIEYCGCNPSTPIKIGDVRQMIEGRFGSLVIYGIKDLSQYFRKALPHEIPKINYIKEKPKLVFPYKVGDRIRCIKLNTWTDTCHDKPPMGICEGKVVEITKVGDFDEACECIPFAATYDGVEYGFSYSDDNKYELVDSFNPIIDYMDIFNKIGMLPLIPKECYIKKQEVKNPLDDSEREVNINFSKPKQIKF